MRRSLVTGQWSKAGLLRPNFQARISGWFATDIVVAEEENAPGTFHVVDRCKGSLHSGDVIHVPGMAEWQQPAERVVHFDGNNAGESHETALITHRVLLFLERKSPEATPSTEALWEPATSWGTWQASFVWLQDGNVYGYSQGNFTMGDSTLHQLHLKEGELREQVMKFAAKRDDYDQALAIDDPALRASAIAKFFSSKNSSAWVTAFQDIAKVGSPALPALRAALKQPDLSWHHTEILLAMSKAGKEEAAPGLLSYLERDVNYWIATAPRLRPGWANDVTNREECERPGNHYSPDLYAVELLGQLHYSPAIATIKSMRQAATMIPPLDTNAVPQNELLQKCDQALEVLAHQPPVE